MHGRISAILLVGLLFCSIFLFSPIVHSVTVNRVLGRDFYFHRELSGIGSYRVLNATYPTYSDNKSIIQTVPIGTWEVGDGWISPEVPRNMTLERAYNFLFSVWGAGSGKATLFFRFYAYRNNVEHFLFSSNPSEQLIINATEMLWQHKTKEVAFEIREGDRLVLRLFVNVSVAGTFGLGYDCSQYPSYVNDPSETRYMRNDEVLGTAQTSTYDSIGVFSGEDPVSLYMGVRVYVLHNDSTTTEITSGSCVAIAYFSSNWKNASWSCPQTSLASDDAVRVEVYCNDFSPPTAKIQTFNTEALNASQLDSSTWTVTYYLYRTKISTIYYWYLRYGSSTYNDRIEGFSWSQGVTKSWHSLTWDFNASTRQWNGVSWAFNLTARQWSGISWIFNTSTMQWNNVTWIMNLTGQEWHSIAWILELPTMAWHSIEWISILSTLGWHSVYWVFTLGEESNIPVLFIGLLFFGFLALAIVGWRLKKRRT